MEHLYHFDLTQDPFQNEPDLRFYFESQTHRRSALRIDRSLRQSKGLTILTGEAGTGKSLLARRIFEELDEEIFEAALEVDMHTRATFLREACGADRNLEDRVHRLRRPQRRVAEKIASTSGSGMLRALPTSRITARAAMVPKVMIWLTRSSPYFSRT